MTDLSNAVWRRGSRCSGNNCMEIAFVDNRIAMRDSKDEQGPVLMFASSEWHAFLRGVRNGEFDLDQQ
jgi:Domain of unknown function (DUF397)